MAILNLGSQEPTDESLPDETPPGLEAIRAWIRKPRPWLRGIRLWIRQFAEWWRTFREWAGKNAVPAARRVTELAAGGAKAARVLAGAAGIAADAGKHIADMGREWRKGDGRSGRMGQAIATRAGQFRDFSIGAMHTAKGAAAIGDAVSRFLEMLPRRKVLDAGPAAGDEDSGPARRLVPVTRRARPKVPPEPIPETLPETLEAAREPASESPEAHEEPLPENPRPLPEPAPDPMPASNRKRPASPPVEGKGPVETPRPPASAAAPKEARRAEALAKLPWPLKARIDALKPKTRKPVLWPLIVDILKERGWTTSSELALLLEMDSRNLTRRHLMPMVRGRVLERHFAERPRHPRQAYRVRAGSDPESR